MKRKMTMNANPTMMATEFDLSKPSDSRFSLRSSRCSMSCYLSPDGYLVELMGWGGRGMEE